MLEMLLSSLKMALLGIEESERLETEPLTLGRVNLPKDLQRLLVGLPSAIETPHLLMNHAKVSDIDTLKAAIPDDPVDRDGVLVPLFGLGQETLTQLDVGEGALTHSGERVFATALGDVDRLLS